MQRDAAASVGISPDHRSSPWFSHYSPHHCQRGLALGCEGLRRPLILPDVCHLGPWVQAACEGSTREHGWAAFPPAARLSEVLQPRPAGQLIKA